MKYQILVYLQPQIIIISRWTIPGFLVFNNLLLIYKAHTMLIETFTCAVLCFCVDRLFLHNSTLIVLP